MEIAGDEIVTRTIDIDTRGGWHDVFFPAGFAADAQDAILRLEPINGEPRFAAAGFGPDDRLNLQRGIRSAAVRIWRHPDARVQPLNSRRIDALGPPTAIAGNVLGQAEVLRASLLPSIEQVVSPLDDCFIQTHPVPGHVSNYVIRDVDLRQAASIEAEIGLAHPDASPVKFAMFLTPSGEDTTMCAALRRAVDRNSVDAGARLACGELHGGERQILTLSTEGLDLSRRYSLVLAAKSSTPGTQYAWAKWHYVHINREVAPYRQTYRYSTFAALANQIQYADGPVAERELNQRLGFGALSTSEGDRFLQTHPVADRPVAARLHAFAPKGMQRLWLEVSNDHANASPAEFGVVLARSVLPSPFAAYHTREFAGARDDALHRLPNGDLLKKTLVSPTQRSWIDIKLPEPLADTSHLYVYVNLRGGSPNFGWLRWHRLAMTIAAESTV